MFKKPTVWASAVAAGVVALAAVPLTLTAQASPPDADSARASSCAARTSADMSLEEQVGQLFISGVDADEPRQAEFDAIRDLHLGGAILTGRQQRRRRGDASGERPGAGRRHDRRRPAVGLRGPGGRQGPASEGPGLRRDADGGGAGQAGPGGAALPCEGLGRAVECGGRQPQPGTGAGHRPGGAGGRQQAHRLPRPELRQHPRGGRRSRRRLPGGHDGRGRRTGGQALPGSRAGAGQHRRQQGREGRGHHPRRRIPSALRLGDRPGRAAW